MSKIAIALAALGVVAGYATAEVLYQKKRKEKTEVPHLGNREDYEKYQSRFMEDDDRPDCYSYFRYHTYDTLLEKAVDAVGKKQYEYKHRNDPKQSSDNNLLFGTFEGHPFGLTINNHKSNRCTNVLTIGYGNSADRSNYIKTNIMQENCSALIVDPYGDLFRALAPELIAKGYPVYLFDPTKSSPTVSNHYNPLDYVYDENGEIDEVQIKILVDIYMKNAKAGKENYGGDPFLDEYERAFLTALIYYVLENDDISKYDKCFNTILKKVQMETVPDNDDEESLLAQEMKAWFAKMDAAGKSYKTKMYYDKFLNAPRKTAKVIITVTTVDLQIFSVDSINLLTRTEVNYPTMNIDFKKICSQQAYLFVVIPTSYRAYEFLYSSLFGQFYTTAYRVGERICRGKYHIGYRKGLPVFDCFDSLEEAESFKEQATVIESNYINDTKIYDIVWKSKNDVGYSKKTCFSHEAAKKYVKDLKNMQIWSGDDVGGGDPALPVHVNVYLNDFANSAYIPNFLTILSTSRGYRIGNHCLINTIMEIEKMYTCGEHETLLANMDTVIYFGSIRQPGADIKLIQKWMGKTTIVNNIPQVTFPMTLEAIDEIGNVNKDGDEDIREIVMVRDVEPFICQKIKPENYKRYEDYKKTFSMFHVEKYFTET